jgi:hypothetical protein
MLSILVKETLAGQCRAIWFDPLCWYGLTMKTAWCRGAANNDLYGSISVWYKQIARDLQRFSTRKLEARVFWLRSDGELVVKQASLVSL